MWGNQGTVCGSLFLPSAICILGVELRLTLYPSLLDPQASFGFSSALKGRIVRVRMGCILKNASQVV